jgi:hypothetical protein
MNRSDTAATDLASHETVLSTIHILEWPLERIRGGTAEIVGFEKLVRFDNPPEFRFRTTVTLSDIWMYLFGPLPKSTGYDGQRTSKFNTQHFWGSAEDEGAVPMIRSRRLR